MKKVTWITTAVVVALAGGGAWWWTQRAKADDVTYRTAKIERGNLQATVSASGAVNPVKQVSVGTQVSGQIKELFVDFNSEVKAGQLIALIDPESFEYRVRSAQADLDSASAAVLTAQANIAASNATVSRAKVDMAEAQRDLDRQQSLVDKGFVAQSVADKARSLVASNVESVKAAQAQLGVTQAQIKSAQANVQQRESALAQARIDLSRTKITSPVDGIVIKRAIEKGQTVAASLQAPELFVIAQNLQDMQVDASIDESDVGRIRNGLKASFTVDAFPGQTFDGEVRQVRKAAQNVANVVTYVAVVGFTNTGGKLLPGMTANVRVITDQRQDVLKVPNAAMRVRIAGVEPAAQGASAPAGAVSPAGAASAASGVATGASRFSFFSEAWAQSAGGSQGGGGGMAAQRERLVTELQLNDEQKVKLEAISAELRPQFAALRDMADDERPAARDKVIADMRQKISAMLTPAQRTKYQEMQANAPARGDANRGASKLPASGVSAATAAAGTSTPPQNTTNSIAARAGNTASNAQNALKNATTSSAPSGDAKAGASAAAAAPAVPAAPNGGQAGQVGQAVQGGAGQGGGGGNGGPQAEFRNRLVTELQLTADQLAKVDAIYAEARPQYGALRDMAAEDRTKARDRITADTRAKIGDILTAEQKPKYAALLAEAGSRTSTRGRIYLLDADGKPVAYNVRLGVTDGTSTELLVQPNSPNAEVFKEGALVVIGTASAAGSAGGGAGNATGAAGARSSGPRLPF
jgi:HlyD family secretion protein